MGVKFPNRVVIKFCTAVGIRDVITHANCGDHRFTRFRIAEGQISRLFIDFGSRRTTLPACDISAALTSVWDCLVSTRQLCSFCTTTYLSMDKEEIRLESIFHCWSDCLERCPWVHEKRIIHWLFLTYSFNVLALKWCVILILRFLRRCNDWRSGHKIALSNMGDNTCSRNVKAI